MGLASSQARLLLLTARKSDLEYRSQMISQRKIMLAMETETLATDYTKGLSNRKMRLVFDTNSADGSALTQDLTYQNVVSANGSKIGNFIVTDAQGKMVVPIVSGQEVLPAGFELRLDADGKKYACYKGKDDQYTPGVDQYFAISEASDQSNDILDPVQFQNSLRNGGLYLQKLDAAEDKFEAKSWQSLDVIQDQLDTSDDSYAQSKYETQSLTIQNQDKMLDLELKQIETQHKAVETEYDSVKKVIDKNIEVSY